MQRILLEGFHSHPVRLDESDPEKLRRAIRQDFLHAYALFESLFDLLKDDTVFYRKSEPTRHPMIFYFGHTAAFYVNKLMLARVINKRINADFESLFAIGVDEMAWDDLDDKGYHWPSVSAVSQSDGAGTDRYPCDRSAHYMVESLVGDSHGDRA